jgi:hypothetical protein
MVTDLWIGHSGDPALASAADVTRALVLVTLTGLLCATVAVVIIAGLAVVR